MFHFITGEYPPKSGGVADYTQLVVHGIAGRGIGCHVWTRGEVADDFDDVVPVHRMGERLVGESLAQLRAGLLSTPDDSRIIVQYVPHAFGEKGMNVAFVRVMDEVARRRRVDLMFHEVAYPWVRWPLKHNLLAAVNRWMVRRLCRHASRAYVSVPAWAPMVRQLAPRRMPIEWSPVPSNVSIAPTYAGRETRLLYGIPANASVVGHFGTYGGAISSMLEAALEKVLAQRSDLRVLLIGQGSQEWLAARSTSSWAGAAFASGQLSAPDTGAALQACDVMIQPYPDGISTRRGTAMACLANGRPMTTNIGALSERFWSNTKAAITVKDSSGMALGDAACELLDDDIRRDALAASAAELYASRFAIDRTIDRLLGTSQPLSFEIP